MQLSFPTIEVLTAVAILILLGVLVIAIPSFVPSIGEHKKLAVRKADPSIARLGLIIGAAFGAIVSSMVGDFIMPVIVAITGGLDFSNNHPPLSSAVETGPLLADAMKAGAALHAAAWSLLRSSS